MVLADGDAVFGRPMSAPTVDSAQDVFMGASSSLAITWDRLSGLTDLPRLGSESSPPDRLVDPGVPLWADLGWRQIAATNLQVEGDDAIRALRRVMSDRFTVRPLVFADSAIAPGVDLMVAVVADRCEYDRQAMTHQLREYRPALQWVGLDPTIYTAAQEETTWSTAVTSKTAYVHNVGESRVLCGRGFQFRMTAVGGPVVSPRVRVTHADGTVEQITWQGLSFTAGQVLTLGDDRVSRVGSRDVSGYVRSLNEDGTPTHAPRFPEWHPGEADDDTQNVVQVSAQSGQFTGFVRSRSGW